MQWLLTGPPQSPSCLPGVIINPVNLKGFKLLWKQISAHVCEVSRLGEAGRLTLSMDGTPPQGWGWGPGLKKEKMAEHGHSSPSAS